MKNSTQNVLAACMKSTQDVIAPALAESSSLEQEQAGLLVAQLRFLAERVDLLGESDRFQLAHDVELGERCLDVLEEGVLEEEWTAWCGRLRRAVQHGRSLLAHGPSGRSEFGEAAGEVRAIVSRVTRHLRALDPVTQEQLRRIVFEAGAALVEFKRSWFAPQGWDPQPETIRPLEEHFARGASGS